MPYTLWSRDTLVGVTEFTLGEQSARHRVGIFQPSVTGMMLLPGITAMAPALFALHDAMIRGDLSADQMDAIGDSDEAFEAFERTPEGRRVMASAQQIAQLELRDPAGRMLPFQSILVSDLDELRRLEGYATGEDGDEPEDTDPPEKVEPPEPVRFVISVTLTSPQKRGTSGHE